MKSLVVQGLKEWFDFDVIADLVDECRLQVPYTIMFLLYAPTLFTREGVTTGEFIPTYAMTW